MLGPSSSPAPTTLAALFIATCQQRCCAVCLFTLACQIAMMLFCKCLSTLSPTSIARQCDCNSCTSSTAIALEPFLLPSRWKWICCFLYAHDEWSVFAARLVAPDQRIYCTSMSMHAILNYGWRDISVPPCPMFAMSTLLTSRPWVGDCVGLS